MKRPLFVLPVFVLALVALGCDSNSSDADLGLLAGEYTFRTYQFVPDSPLLEPVDMRDTLVTAQTRLQLFSSGRFTLLYQFAGATPRFIGGDARATSRGVRLSGQRSDEGDFSALLLPIEFELRQDANARLTANISRRVNLAAFSDRYRGLPSVEGKLLLTLERN